MLSRIDEKLWKTGWYIYYPLYILSLVGFNLVAPKYLSYFSAIVKVYISLLLLWKFNPFKNPICVNGGGLYSYINLKIAEEPTPDIAIGINITDLKNVNNEKSKTSEFCRSSLFLKKHIK